MSRALPPKWWTIEPVLTRLTSAIRRMLSPGIPSVTRIWLIAETSTSAREGPWIIEGTHASQHEAAVARGAHPQPAETLPQLGGAAPRRPVIRLVERVTQPPLGRTSVSGVGTNVRPKRAWDTRSTKRIEAHLGYGGRHAVTVHRGRGGQPCREGDQPRPGLLSGPCRPERSDQARPRR